MTSWPDADSGFANLIAQGKSDCGRPSRPGPDSDCREARRRRLEFPRRRSQEGAQVGRAALRCWQPRNMQDREIRIWRWPSTSTWWPRVPNSPAGVPGVGNAYRQQGDFANAVTFLPKKPEALAPKRTSLPWRFWARASRFPDSAAPGSGDRTAGALQMKLGTTRR